jgi:hypothetical protein
MRRHKHSQRQSRRQPHTFLAAQVVQTATQHACMEHQKRQLPQAPPQPQAGAVGSCSYMGSSPLRQACLDTLCCKALALGAISCL